MSNPAVDEYNSLIANASTNRLSGHPDDGFDDATTIAASTTSRGSNAPSLKQGALRSRNPNSSKYPYEDDSSDGDEARDGEGSGSGSRKQSTYYIPQSYDRDAMTGPKGVIADAGAFEREKKRGGRSKQYARTVELALPRVQAPAQSTDKSTDEDADLDEDEEERKLAEKRRKEIIRQNARAALTMYCGLARVDAMGFLEAVESAARGLVVVVYLFDDQSQHQSDLSSTFASLLASIAQAHTASAKFVALHCTEAEIDPAGTPAILAYRDGEKFADIMPLVDEVPDRGDLEAELALLLKERRILL